jgi:hypothetical protein
MIRSLGGTLILLAVAPAVLGQAPTPLALHPAPAPSPSLKYRLLPERREQVPGNAAALYYRTLAMFFENTFLLKDLREDHWDAWLAVPLKDLPVKEAGEKVGITRNFLKEIGVATHCRQCDWQLEERPEGMSLMLPDLTGFRRFGIVLAVRARVEIREKRLPDALQTIQMGYTMAHHLGEGPTLAHVLTAAGIVQMMNDRLEELVEQPGAPNLYWTLTALPRPFFDPRGAFEEEGTVLERTWPWLKRLEVGPMTPSQLKSVQGEIRKTLDYYGIRPSDPKQGLDRDWSQTSVFPEAKKALLTWGTTADQVEAMPAFQVVAIYAYRDTRQTWEELAKWSHVAGAWREAGYKEAVQKHRDALAQLDRLFFHGLLRTLEVNTPLSLQKSEAPLPLEQVEASIGRTDRRIAALRCIEALRMYAAHQEGRLPATLKEITEVPIPDDPVTSKPFGYTLTSDKAKLSAPAGDNPALLPRLVYEIELAK